MKRFSALLLVIFLILGIVKSIPNMFNFSFTETAKEIVQDTPKEEITETKQETQDNLEIPTFRTTQETCEVTQFSEPENVHQNLELPKFMETK